MVKYAEMKGEAVLSGDHIRVPVSISARPPVRKAMHSNIYDQADIHRNYECDGIGNGPSPELVEQSLRRMAERGSVPSVVQNGNVCERIIYVASIDLKSLERNGCYAGMTAISENDRITVYSDDGFDTIPGSHDVFELINDLEDLFTKITRYRFMIRDSLIPF